MSESHLELSVGIRQFSFTWPLIVRQRGWASLQNGRSFQRTKAAAVRPLETYIPNLGQHHFYHTLVVKPSHKAAQIEDMDRLHLLIGVATKYSGHVFQSATVIDLKRPNSAPTASYADFERSPTRYFTSIFQKIIITTQTYQDY